MNVEDKHLAVISPHFKLFLRDQIVAISHFFKETTVIIPQPYFPKNLLNIPLFERSFPFLRPAVESCAVSPRGNNITVNCPRFFSLPIEVMRKRGPILSANCTIRALSKTSLKFDLVHAHRLDFGFAGAILKDMINKPLIITCHGSDVYEFPSESDFSHSIAEYTLRRANNVIAVCKSDSDKLLSLGLDSRKLSVIPNGFDDDLFLSTPQNSARAKLGLPPTKKILLAVGALGAVKGHIYFIKAMQRVSKTRSDVIAVIVGSGPLESKLRKEIARLDLDEKVFLIGREPHNKIPLWINASDIFVMPSLNEGFPTVIPEVMACGKPIIGTNVGGIPDALSDENVGMLVDAADSEALAQAILDSLDRKWPYERIYESAQKYSLKTITAQVIKIYRNVLAE